MNNLMVQQVMTITMLIMIQVMVEKTMETLWTLLMPVVDHLVNLAATQGEMVDQLQTQHHNDNSGESSRLYLPREMIWSRDHPFDLIIGDPDVGV